MAKTLRQAHLARARSADIRRKAKSKAGLVARPKKKPQLKNKLLDVGLVVAAARKNFATKRKSLAVVINGYQVHGSVADIRELISNE